MPFSFSDGADSPAGNCSGMTPMPMRFERWMRSDDSAMTRAPPSSQVPLAASPGQASRILCRRDDDKWNVLCRMVLRRVVDERLRPVRLGEVAGVAARYPALDDGVEQLVAKTDVGERSADHHLVIAATRTVGVVILLRDAVGLQVLRGRVPGLMVLAGLM